MEHCESLTAARSVQDPPRYAAWLEDHRREANGTLANRTLGLALASLVSPVWKGYWQRAA